MKNKVLLLAVALMAVFACTTGCTDENDQHKETQHKEIQHEEPQYGAHSQPDTSTVADEQQVIPDMYALGSAVREIRGDGTALTLEDEAALLKANQAGLGKEMTDEEAMYQIKRRHVIFAEAQRLGISASLDEARRYLENMFTLIKSGLDSDSEAERTSSRQVQEMMQQYIDGMGITMEEYIELAAPSIQWQLSADALMQHFCSTLDVGVTADREQLEKLYNEYIDGLMAAAE